MNELESEPFPIPGTARGSSGILTHLIISPEGTKIAQNVKLQKHYRLSEEPFRLKNKHLIHVYKLNT